MIEHLSDLTIQQFVDLICGDLSIIGASDMKEAADVARRIAMEYQDIADSAGVLKHISRRETILKAKLNVSLFTMCKNLAALGRYDLIKELFDAYGLNGDRPEKAIDAEISVRLARAKNIIEKEGNNGLQDVPEDKDIRKEFDAQTANLMAYFKFQIDTATMKASVYAHLVARHNRELKQKIAEAKRK